MYKIESNSVIIEDVILRVDFSIKQHIYVNGILIVMLEIPLQLKYNENVFGVDLTQKKIIWQISKIKYINEDCPYQYLKSIDEELLAINWCGFYVTFDIYTGHILRRGDTK